MLQSRYLTRCILLEYLLISCLSLLQLHFNLQTAERWYEIYGGFDYRGLYNYIVDFFEDVQESPAKKRAQDLLNWWSL